MKTVALILGMAGGAIIGPSAVSAAIISAGMVFFVIVQGMPV